MAVVNKEVGEEFNYIKDFKRITITLNIKINVIIYKIAKKVLSNLPLIKENLLRLLKAINRKGPSLNINKPEAVLEIESIYSVKIYNIN